VGRRRARRREANGWVTDNRKIPMPKRPQGAPPSTGEIVRILRSSPLFKDVPTDDIERVARSSARVTADRGDVLFTEGDASTDVYVILAGAVEVLRTDSEKHRPFSVARLYVGDHFGEIALVAGEVRSATVRAVEPTLLLALTSEDIARMARDDRPVYTTVLINLLRELSRRLRATNEVALGAMKNELRHEQARRSMGAFLIKNLLFLSGYVVGLNLFAEYAMGGGVPIDVGIKLTIGVALFIKIANALFAMAMMRRGQYPMSFYGFSMRGWVGHVGWSLVWTLIFIAVMTLVKWIVVHTVAGYRYEPVLNFALAAFLFDVHDSSSYLLAASLFVLLYLVFATAQEIIVRASLQNPLSQFLIGRYRVFWAIVISNALFASTHVHIDPLIPFFIFFPGLFWGVIYFRQRSLAGVILSHTLVGCWAFLGLGIVMP
jgi:CRP-like cAMP-binding protein/membrane protease YdiL (CAAX protease family)